MSTTQWPLQVGRMTAEERDNRVFEAVEAIDVRGDRLTYAALEAETGFKKWTLDQAMRELRKRPGFDRFVERAQVVNGKTLAVCEAARSRHEAGLEITYAILGEMVGISTQKARGRANWARESGQWNQDWIVIDSRHFARVGPLPGTPPSKSYKENPSAEERREIAERIVAEKAISLGFASRWEPR